MKLILGISIVKQNFDFDKHDFNINANKDNNGFNWFTLNVEETFNAAFLHLCQLFSSYTVYNVNV